MKNGLTILRLVLEHDGSITASERGGYSLDINPQIAEALLKHFTDGAREVFFLGKFYAPKGSVERTRLMLVRKARESERWQS